MLKELAKKITESKEYEKKISMGFDGYVDQIIKAVDSRENDIKFNPITTIEKFGHRILSAAGKSTNIELHTENWKLGGNGPILVNSIANLGAKVTYIGALGTPQMHKVFNSMHSNCELHSISQPGHTLAVEFDDGKIMFGQLAMTDLDWEKITGEISGELLEDFFFNSDLIGMVNWTQTPHMEAIWQTLIDDYLPKKNNIGIKPFLFVDIADPEKRTKKDILKMLSQLKSFSKFYRVVLGLNEKESFEIAKVIEKTPENNDSKSLQLLAKTIRCTFELHACVIHPVKFAVSSFETGQDYHIGPYEPNPKITTGAGDHFNAGFCFGLVHGFSPKECIATGVANSGYYVKNAASATTNQLSKFLEGWEIEN